MAYMNNMHFLNGNIVTEEDLTVSPRDLGYSRGYAVFEFFRTYRGRPFMLNFYLDRLFRSASHIKLNIPWSKEQIKTWILQTLEANLFKEEKAVKIIISGGISRTLVPPQHPTIIIMIDSVIDFPLEMYENGISATTLAFKRYIPEAKTTNYIEAVTQMQNKNKTHPGEIIYYDNLSTREGSCSNVFAVIDNELVTPATQILEGVTRKVLLEKINPPLDINVRDFPIEDLKRASEVFITVSAKEIVPIVSIDGSKVGDGNVGLITKTISDKFKEFVDDNKW